ncbi:hypothetical protein DFH08DRAFT_1011770 [Mycena albidolilacea]|uniref:Uncharacterized protein n=1 Tax=Mycena albidolilacea TaxID=1033008 RepID=A0AAD6ZV88_9AGAR|nr:hypothetical protein DFH08DRAFT_1011770 [Mycena albidolilacea]
MGEKGRYKKASVAGEAGIPRSGSISPKALPESCVGVVSTSKPSTVPGPIRGSGSSQVDYAGDRNTGVKPKKPLPVFHSPEPPLPPVPPLPPGPPVPPRKINNQLSLPLGPRSSAGEMNEHVTTPASAPRTMVINWLGVGLSIGDERCRATRERLGGGIESRCEYGELRVVSALAQEHLHATLGDIFHRIANLVDQSSIFEIREAPTE